MTLMQQTSIDAFYTLDDLGSKQRAVYDTLLSGPKTNRQVSQALGWEINRVTPRMNELVSMGLVTDHGTTVDPQTRKRAILWGIVEKQMTFA